MKLETQPPAPPKEIWCVPCKNEHGGWTLVGPFASLDDLKRQVNGLLIYKLDPLCYQLKPVER